MTTAIADEELEIIQGRRIVRTARNVGNGVLNTLANPTVNRVAGIVGGIAATTAFIAACVAIAPKVVGVASAFALAAAVVGVGHSAARVWTGQSTWRQESLNIGINAVSFVTGGASIKFTSFRALNNSNVAQALSFNTSRTFSIAGGTMSFGEQLGEWFRR